MMALKPPRTALAGHTAGIFADMTLDGPEIGTLVAVVDRAKNLPNRKTMGKQDPYCAMRLGKEAKKTDTDRRGGQTPKWDQELRFTVHDSPDYYRLKCSVFNDDKKTDLIGEAWISLVELIKPGGGSNDLWHQLNYKGKYAGDVRVELTYYDLRPREEKILERKKGRERVSTAQSENTSPASMPRQLGPRDVRRRPLPASPATATPASASPVQTPPASSRRHEPPALPPKIPFDQHDVDKTYPTTTPREIQDYQPTPIYDHDVLNVAAPLHHYRQPFCEEQSPVADHQGEHAWPTSYEHPSPLSYDTPSPSGGYSPSSLPPSTWPSDLDDWDQQGQRQSYQSTNMITDQSALSRALPCPPTSLTEQPYTIMQSCTVPANAASLYRDSPLRQSTNQEDIAYQMVQSSHSYDTPPPPPVHRGATARKRQEEYPPTSSSRHGSPRGSLASQTYGTTPRRLSIDDRSPLQRIEQRYGPHAETQALMHSQYDMQNSHDLYEGDVSRQSDDPAIPIYDSPSGNNSYEAYESHDPPASIPDPFIRQNWSDSPTQNLTQPITGHRNDAGTYAKRHSFNSGLDMQHYYIEGNSHSQPDLTQTQLRRPEPLRPQSDGVDARQRPQRKAVSEEPYPVDAGRRMSAVPFGPDAYDVLNPASSPVTNNKTVYQTPAQTKEAARLREVEKLRDQGPIIGNDGRVIDPSDHLPSDTWAPEPERKQRRPEHVIHVRTKNNTHSRVDPNIAERPTYTSQKQQMPVQEAPYPSATISSASAGRRRLQKQAPTRPLPSQPYPQPRPPVSRGHSSGNSPVSGMAPGQALQRYAYQDHSPTPQRPSLSEYQVPTNSSYIPRGSSYQHDYHTQPLQPQINTGREYDPRHSNVFDDPLAAEMNMIDIGPSKGAYVALNGRRGY